ncbi:MAG: MBL fold metallo-hydrolase [Candidatus Omnitrophica bacterium]|nr:MBL fold metallo-hydrolase [Candidatus Omnitrophota bacterium]MCM8771203.1 MBL fold metallo-hydrolase [Candidatus Omnitrophota bacterium]
MILKKLVVGPLQANCYILGDEHSREAVVIDPGADAPAIKDILNKFKLKLSFVINTHGHIDHIGADPEFNVPICIHREDIASLKDAQKNLSLWLDKPFAINSLPIKTLEDKETIVIGKIALKVIHTPGHTAGSICLLLDNKHHPKIIFSGDTLFRSGVGRTDIPGGSWKDLILSLKNRILILPDDTLVYPGHGLESTIGKERKENPYA